METTLALIPLAPLLGVIATYLIGVRIPSLAGWVATAASALSFVFTLQCFFAVPEQGALEIRPFTWFSVGELQVDFTLRFDQLTAVMCLVVTGIGSLIHLYSISYMAEDECRPRFFAYLNLFMFSMLLLVLGGNLLVLFVGWEGVGLCSYLLIGFWFKNKDYAAAGRKAFVVNRIGDLGFLVGIFILFWTYGSVDFVELAKAISAINVSPAVYYWAALFLFIGATGKSAQIPLFVWLPDAMAGPTPVSALIHAATMVTAGVYMMARMHFLYALTPEALVIVGVIAVLTAFVAATTALTQFDIKKVLAYSTVSQLGFMFMAIAANAYWVAIFHVVTHAFFKACLFLGAGSVIHGCHHEQDMRHMGGLLKKMPITALTYGVATLAIAGIAPLSGYYSKHAIISALELQTSPAFGILLHLMVALASVTAFLTAFYMTRSFAMTFLGEYRGHAHPHESPWPMSVVLLVLGFLSLVGGYVLGNSSLLQHYLSAVLPAGHHHASESMAAALMHSWIGFLGVGLALFLYTQARSVPGMVYQALLPIGRLFSAKYYVDELYRAVLIRPLEHLAQALWKDVDQSVIDGAVNGTAVVIDVSGEVARVSQTGQVRHYVLFMFLGTLGILAFYFVLR